MKYIIAALFFIMVPFSASALDLGLPKVGGGGGASGGNIDESVSAFVKRSSFLAETAAKSLRAINSAFESTEEAAKKKAELDGILGKTDPKERDAALKTFIESDSAAAEKNAKAADVGEKVKALSAEKQKNMASAVFNFLIAAVSAPKLADDGQKIISQASVTNAMKIIPVKDALPLLQRFVKDGTGSMAGFAKVLKGANIEVPAATAESKPADVSY